MKVLFHFTCLIEVGHIYGKAHQLHFSTGNVACHVVAVFGADNGRHVFALHLGGSQQSRGGGYGLITHGRGDKLF